MQSTKISSVEQKAVIELVGFEERLVLNNKFVNFFKENCVDVFDLKGYHYVSANIRENPLKSFSYEFIPTGLDIVICYANQVSNTQMLEYMQKNNSMPLSSDNLFMLTSIKTFQDFLVNETGSLELKDGEFETEDKDFIAPAHQDNLATLGNDGDKDYSMFPCLRVKKRRNFPGDHKKDFFLGPIQIRYDFIRLNPFTGYFLFFKPKFFKPKLF